MKTINAIAVGLFIFTTGPLLAEPAKGEAGIVTIELDSDLNQSPVGEFIEMPLTLRDAQGKAIANAAITVDGGMAMHGHGLPTAPVVEELGEGRYVIKGLKFSMGGEWQLQLSITTGTASDTVDFEFVL